MYILLAVLVLGLAFLANFAAEQTEKYQDENWKQTLQDENAEMKQQMKEDDMMGGFTSSQIEKITFTLSTIFSRAAMMLGNS